MGLSALSNYGATHKVVAQPYYRTGSNTTGLAWVNGQLVATKPQPTQVAQPKAPTVQPKAPTVQQPAPVYKQKVTPVATAQNSQQVTKQTTTPTSAVASTNYSAPDYESLDAAQAQSDYASGLSSVNPSVVTPTSAIAQQAMSTQPAWANPDVQIPQSSFANPEYDKFVASGGNLGSPSSSFGSNWLYKDVNAMPDNIKNADPLVQAEWLKSPTAFQSGLSALGTGVSALSGLYGMYNANKNYQLQKQQQDAVLAQARASEANRSAMAKAFGSTYIPAQF